MSDCAVVFTFQGSTVRLPSGTTEEQARATLAHASPDVRNATFVPDGAGGGSFVPRTGTKG